MSKTRSIIAGALAAVAASFQLSAAGQAPAQDLVAAKLRAAAGKSLVKAIPPGTDVEGAIPVAAAARALKRGYVLQLAPGNYGANVVNIDDDNVIVEGAPEEQDPGKTIATLNVTGDGCVVRRIRCASLKIKKKVSLVDCVVDELDFAFDEQKRKAKCSLLAVNCAIRSCNFKCPKDYEIQVVRNGVSTRELVKVSGTNCEFKFKGCAFYGNELFKLDGNVELDLAKCVISAHKIFDIDRSLGGKSEICIEDCLVFQDDGLTASTPTEFMKELRKEAAQATMKGKLFCLEKSPFAFEREATTRPPSFPSLKALSVIEDSPGSQLDSGLALNSEGFPGPELADADSKAQPKQKDDASSATAKPAQNDKASDLDKELKDAAKKLSGEIDEKNGAAGADAAKKPPAPEPPKQEAQPAAPPPPKQEPASELDKELRDAAKKLEEAK